MEKKYKVCFVHPDLGIGGAERLVVDAALALQKKGCDVTIMTSHHDKNHCFKETADGTLAVEVYGDWLPRHFFGCFYIIFALLRSLWLGLHILRAQRKLPKAQRFDAYFVDQVSVSIPILKKTGGKVLFYCHHPDMVLSNHGSFIKRLYRLPFDALEEYTTGMADVIFANSIYTLGVILDTFTSICAKHGNDNDLMRAADPRNTLTPNKALLKKNKIAHIPIVLYPSITTEQYDQPVDEHAECPIPNLPTGKTYVISINRFERKKNIGLAIKALARMKSYLPLRDFENVHLVVAGGYDPRLPEIVEHLKELQQLSTKCGVSSKVTFLPNFTNEQRSWLFAHASCLVYTPENEHYGIVPIEGMYSRVPVVACNSGGPRETVLNEKTGFLASGNPDSFAQSISSIISMGEKSRRKMGAFGRESVIRRFSFDAFSNLLYATMVKSVEENFSTDLNRKK